MERNYMSKDEQMNKLCDLWMSCALDELEKRIEKFNIFTALKLDNTEIRHSNFLAWLMNPRESHNIGDYFLKVFLELSMKDYIQDNRIEINPVDILGARYWDCEIRREYKNIDILIINPDNKFLCVLENKIWSGEHDEQLERYAQIVNKEFAGYKKLYLFLTPASTTEPLLERKCKIDSQEICTYYIQIGYDKVLKALEKTLQHRSSIMANGVQIFIEHYKKMVERNIMGQIDKDVLNSCRKIYREHKEAIDLINSCSNMTDELTENIQELFNEDLEYLSDGMFALKKIKNKEKYQIGNSKYGRDIILLQLEKNKGGYCFCINVVTPENGSELDRKNLIKKIENKLNINFKSNKQESWHYYNKPIITEDKYYNFDDLETAKQFLKSKIDETKIIPTLYSLLNDQN